MSVGRGPSSVLQVVCACCGTPYDDDPAVRRLRRCPGCGSRLIRQADGSLLANPTAPPPPAKPDSSVFGRPRASAGTPWLVVGIVCLILSIVAFVLVGGTFSLGMMGRSTPGVMQLVLIVAFLVLLAGGIAALTAASRGGMTAAERQSGQPTTAGQYKFCISCNYPLALTNCGRCTECGRLQNPLDPRNYRCPGCLRMLRGFHGDDCPECGADVRGVTDGPPANADAAP